MKTLRVLSLTLLVLAAASCSGRNIEIVPLSDNETIPQPNFSAKNVSRAEQSASYSQVRVYDVTDKCKAPICPLFWQVVVSDTGSPQKITYGALPSFGSITIVPPRGLKAGHRYEMILDQKEAGPSKDSGSIVFEVTEAGRIVAVAE
jgi:hypothetical protein